MNSNKLLLIIIVLIIPAARAAVLYGNNPNYDQLVFHINDSIIITSDCEINALFDSNYTGTLINITLNPPVSRRSLIVNDCHGSSSYEINVVFKNQKPINESIAFSKPVKEFTGLLKPVLLRSPFGLINFNLDYSFFLNHFFNGEHDYLIHPYSDEILNLTLSITEGSFTRKEAITRLTLWVDQNIVYDYFEFLFPWLVKHPDDFSILRSRRGICYDFAVLLISMANSIGVDARRVNFISIPESFTPLNEIKVENLIWYHVFTEFYDDEWLTADPITGVVSSNELFEKKGYSPTIVYTGEEDLTSNYRLNASITSVSDSGFVQTNSSNEARVVVSYFNKGSLVDYWVSSPDYSFNVPINGLEAVIELRDRTLLRVYDSKTLKL